MKFQSVKKQNTLATYYFNLIIEILENSVKCFDLLNRILNRIRAYINRKVILID